MLTAERQWQIQLLEVEKQAWAFEGKESQRDDMGSDPLSSLNLLEEAQQLPEQATGERSFDFPSKSQFTYLSLKAKCFSTPLDSNQIQRNLASSKTVLKTTLLSAESHKSPTLFF